MHPAAILFQDKPPPLALPVCDHYAGSEKLMLKSLSLQQELGPVFDITFDCEDGAQAGDEAAHARLIGALLNSAENRFNRVGVRVHDMSSEFFEQDVRLICQQAAQRLAYLVVPKVGGVAEVQQAVDLITRYAQQNGRENQLPIHVLIETHDALREVQAIAALPQIECLSFGIMDFISAHYGAIPANAMRSPGQFTHPLVMRAKLEIAAACHAHGKAASHNVTTEINDVSIVTNDANRAAAELGYTRMWSVHPKHIKPILKAFTPRNTEINEASSILAKAQQAQWGPIQHHGKLHDRASYRYYWTILQRAKSSGLPLPDAAIAFI